MVKRSRCQKAKGSLTVYGVFCSQEAKGRLVIGAGPDEVMSISRLGRQHRGKIVFSGALISREVRLKGSAIGVAAFLGGGMHRRDYNEGTTPVCLIEGWGRLTVGDDLWQVLSVADGKEVILAPPKVEEIAAVSLDERVRLIGDPGPVGTQGVVVGDLRQRAFFGDLKLKTVKVKIKDQVHEVPLANLEVLPSET